MSRLGGKKGLFFFLFKLREEEEAEAGEAEAGEAEAEEGWKEERRREKISWK
jgi:hypothetical protein